MGKMNIGTYAMALVGLGMILYNAYGYLSGQYDGAPAFTAMGIVFVAVGMAIAKRQRKIEKGK